MKMSKELQAALENLTIALKPLGKIPAVVLIQNPEDDGIIIAGNQSKADTIMFAVDAVNSIVGLLDKPEKKPNLTLIKNDSVH